MLLAEGDRDAYRREQAALAREREIMKDVKGWEVRCCTGDQHVAAFNCSAQVGKSPYHGDRPSDQKIVVL